jgi:hypothetical protein
MNTAHENGRVQLIQILPVNFSPILAKIFSVSTNVDLTSDRLGFYVQETFPRPVAAETP